MSTENISQKKREHAADDVEKRRLSFWYIYISPFLKKRRNSSISDINVFFFYKICTLQGVNESTPRILVDLYLSVFDIKFITSMFAKAVPTHETTSKGF